MLEEKRINAFVLTATSCPWTAQAFLAQSSGTYAASKHPALPQFSCPCRKVHRTSDEVLPAFRQSRTHFDLTYFVFLRNRWQLVLAALCPWSAPNRIVAKQDTQL